MHFFFEAGFPQRVQSLILRLDEDDAGVPARDAGAAAPGSRSVGFWDMTGEWMRDAPRARRVSRARVWHLPMRSEPGAFPRKRRNVVVAIILIKTCQDALETSTRYTPLTFRFAFSAFPRIASVISPVVATSRPSRCRANVRSTQSGARWFSRPRCAGSRA